MGSGTSHPSRYSGNRVQQFWRWFRTRPEILATIQIPITDILGDRPDWTTTDGKPLSKGKLRKAKRFWRDNRGKEVVRAWLFDAFLTGSGFLWKGSPSDKEVRKAVKEVIRSSPSKFEHLSKLSFKELLIKANQDEDLKKPKKIDYVASSTVEIQHDESEIKSYLQRSNGLELVFLPEEIIHFRYLTLNGMVRGFTPVIALVHEVMLLDLVKQNMVAFMENGGVPDKVFVLPKEIAKSRNHKYLIEQLRKYKKIVNSHGNLVFTGELDVKDLQGSPNDLEYKDLALYITSNIAFAYGIPVTRIPYLIGNSASRGDTGGLSESGYWNRISDLQDSIEDLLNSQLFELLGYHIKFVRKYKQDEVREAQTMSMNADTVTKFQEILAKDNKQMTCNKILELLSFSPEDIEELSQESLIAATRMTNQNMLGNDQMMNEQDKNESAQTQKNVANQKGSGEALYKP